MEISLLSCSTINFFIHSFLVSIYHCFSYSFFLSTMSSDSPDVSESELCEYLLEEDDYQPVISESFTVNFTPASFSPFYLYWSLFYFYRVEHR